MNLTITTEEKRWHGCVYYTAFVYLNSGDINDSNQTWNNIQKWCTQTFGLVGDPWVDSADRWYLNGGSFWFRNNDDLLMFVLRWQ